MRCRGELYAAGAYETREALRTLRVNLFKDLSGSLARFVMAWLVPSASAVAVFAVVVLPDLQALAPSAQVAGNQPLQAALLFSVAVLILSVLFAYGSLPIYRFLEGYSMPAILARRLVKRRLREWYRLQAQYKHELRTGLDWHVTLEKLAAYPDTPKEILPTRLGNALRAMEGYGGNRFGLESQSLWYELLSATSDGLRRDAEDTRAGVDFFISGLVHLVLLATVSACVTVWSATTGSISIGSAIVTAVSLILVKATYNQAVSNVGEWRLAIRALVNTGRLPLAQALGLRLPPTFEEERVLWDSYVGLIAHGPHPSYLRFLNRYRVETLDENEDVVTNLAATAGP
jgi:hypothetical protein